MPGQCSTVAILTGIYVYKYWAYGSYCNLKKSIESTIYEERYVLTNLAQQTLLWNIDQEFSIVCRYPAKLWQLCHARGCWSPWQPFHRCGALIWLRSSQIILSCLFHQIRNFPNNATLLQLFLRTMNIVSRLSITFAYSFGSSMLTCRRWSHETVWYCLQGLCHRLGDATGCLISTSLATIFLELYQMTTLSCTRCNPCTSETTIASKVNAHCSTLHWKVDAESVVLINNRSAHHSIWMFVWCKSTSCLRWPSSVQRKFLLHVSNVPAKILSCASLAGTLPEAWNALQGLQNIEISHTSVTGALSHSFNHKGARLYC